MTMMSACARKHARMLACMHAIFWRAYAHISANLGQIGKIEISTESGGHTGHDYDVCACAHKHACMLACMHACHFLACLGPYLIQSRSDWKDRDIYGIGGTYRS